MPGMLAAQVIKGFVPKIPRAVAHGASREARAYRLSGQGGYAPKSYPRMLIGGHNPPGLPHLQRGPIALQRAKR